MKPLADPFSRLYLTLAYLILLALLHGCAAPILAPPIIAAGAGATVALNDERPGRVILDDNGIVARIKDKVYDKFKPEKQIHLNVTSYNGVVLLTGETLTRDMRGQVLDIAQQQEKVRRVHNELRVTALTTITSRSNDTWITSKVKTQMFATENFKASKVKVVTEFGSVYLIGLVSRETGTQAAEIARDVSGVKRVVKLFEYF